MKFQKALHKTSRNAALNLQYELLNFAKNSKTHRELHEPSQTNLSAQEHPSERTSKKPTEAKAKLILLQKCISLAKRLAKPTTGSANPKNVAKWAKWLAEPIDRELLAAVQEIFEPVKNIGHVEGLPENN